eukprot:Colp12_sorted_trinity150504_noHs@30655
MAGAETRLSRSAYASVENCHSSTLEAPNLARKRLSIGHSHEMKNEPGSPRDSGRRVTDSVNIRRRSSVQPQGSSMSRSMSVVELASRALSGEDSFHELRTGELRAAGSDASQISQMTPEDVRRMLEEKNAAANATCVKSSKDLLKACSRGDVSAVQRLIAAKVDVNQPSKSGMTPLMYAALYSRKEIAELLLSVGAKVDVTDHQGMTALQYAEGNPVYEILSNALPDEGRPLKSEKLEISVTKPVQIGSWFSRHTLYTVEVRTDSRKYKTKCFSVTRRYRQFIELYEQMENYLENNMSIPIRTILPPPPAKTYFNRNDSDVVEVRRRYFERMLVTASQIDHLAKFVIWFLSAVKEERSSSNSRSSRSSSDSLD